MRVICGVIAEAEASTKAVSIFTPPSPISNFCNLPVASKKTKRGRTDTTISAGLISKRLFFDLKKMIKLKINRKLPTENITVKFIYCSIDLR
jgi:preprotein translocase subunit Sec61beta